METKQKRIGGCIMNQSRHITRRAFLKKASGDAAVFVLCINGLAGKGYCQQEVFTLEGLVEKINDLPDDVLSDQVKNSLVSKVNNALKAVNKEKYEAAINILGAFINQVEAQRGKKISEETANMLIGYANNVIAQIAQIKVNFDLEIRFNNTDGTCIACADGLIYIFGGGEYPDPNLVYAEEYWGEYPLYLPGNNAAIVVDVTYNGPADQVNMSVVTETYIMELDGSNGAQIFGPDTTDFTVNKGETKLIDSSFILPANGKGLNRIIVKVYNDGNLLMTKEGIFCPPELMQ